MKAKRFLVVLASAFLLSACELSSGGGNGGASLGEEVDYKTFVSKLLDSAEKNEFFIKDGVKSNKAVKASGNINLSLKSKVNDVESEYFGIKLSGKVDGQVDIDNDIAKADFSYKIELNNKGVKQSQEDTFSGQLQGDEGKLYAVDLKESKSSVLLEEFPGFKYYLNYIPEYLAKSENWKEEYYQLMTEEYDEMMKENEEFKKIMDSGLIKYYVNGDSYTAKLAGKASVDIPITSKEVSDTGEVSEIEKTSYVLALDVSGSETVKMDLTNGNESYSMSGNMGINITLKDAEESVSFLEDQKLSNGDSIGISLSAKFSASIKDADVSLEKVSV